MLNFNQFPYFDDFDKSKNFIRILFKPGIPVQSRELTQLQTAIQNQITQFGNAIFKEGTVVLGGNTFNDRVEYFYAVDSNGIALSDVVALQFDGQVIKSVSGFKGVVIGVDGNKLYYKSASGIQLDKATRLTNDIGTIELYTKNADDFKGFCNRFSIEESVYFVNGVFVVCNKHSHFYADNTSEKSYCIGLTANEYIVTSDDDYTLLDPAQGSYNYSAPGADRYAIELKLTSYEYNPLDLTTVSTNQPNNFIEIARVSGDDIVSKQKTEYSGIGDELARRTYDESGNYTVNPFITSVIPHVGGDAEKLSIKIEAGKAYVRGYEFETTTPTYFDLPRSRTTNQVTDYPVAADLNNIFIYVKNVSSTIPLAEYHAATLTKGDGTVIGECYLRGMKYYAFISSNHVYKLYLDGVKFISGFTLNDLAFVKVGSTFSAMIDVASYTSGAITLGNATANIINVPKTWVKTFQDTLGNTNIIVENNITISAPIAYVSGSSPAQSKAVISLPNSNDRFIGTGNLSSDAVNDRFIVSVTGVSGGTPSVGTVMTYDDGLRVNVLPGGSSAEVTYPTSINGTVSVTCSIQSSINVTKKKTNSTKSDTITTPYASKINLTEADGISLQTVVATFADNSTEDITAKFSFSGGQNDFYYGLSSITAITELPVDIVSLEVSYSFYAHTGSGIFTVDSYTTSGINYDTIPSYVSSDGKTYALRDCLDFRARQSSDGTFVNDAKQIVNGSTITVDFTYYQGRKDKLVVTKDKKFSLIQGIPSDNPSLPSDLPSAMTIYNLNVPAYTLSESSVSSSYVDNRRYTMRDIGRIDKKVGQLTYYTSMSLLEKQAQGEKFPSNIPGVEKFKNGILVDPFIGHAIGDVSNPDYKCAIDYNNRFCRPQFTSKSFTFVPRTLTNALYQSGLVTLDYTEETISSQPFATRVVNLNPFFVFDWTGSMSMNPPSDTWIDTDNKPSVTVNLNGENDVFSSFVDNISNPASTGVKWTDWQTTVKGFEYSNTSVVGDQEVTNSIKTEDSSARVGMEVSKSDIKTITTDLGEKVVDLSVIPFIRAQHLDFISRGVKPSTDFYAFFDGIEVTTYCSPADELYVNEIVKDADRIKTSDGTKTARVCGSRTGRVYIINEGNERFAAGDSVVWYKEDVVASSITSTVSQVVEYDVLSSSDVGICAGTFNLPNNNTLRFKTGERYFRLQDEREGRCSSVSEFKFIASGFSQAKEQTFLATRVQQVSVAPKFETNPGAVQTSTSTETIVREPTDPAPAEVTRDPAKAVETTIPAVPVTPTIPCGVKTAFLDEPYLEYQLDFGTGSGGLYGIKYKHYDEPVWFEIIWNGNTFRSDIHLKGKAKYDKMAKYLRNDYGYFKGSGTADRIDNYNGEELTFLFNKTKDTPRYATLKIFNPLSNKRWNNESDLLMVDNPRTTPSYFTVICPEKSDAVTTSFARTNAPTNIALGFSGTANKREYPKHVYDRCVAKNRGIKGYDVISGYIWHLTEAQRNIINSGLVDLKTASTDINGFPTKQAKVNKSAITVNSISVVNVPNVFKIDGWYDAAVATVEDATLESWNKDAKAADLIMPNTDYYTSRCQFRIKINPMLVESYFNSVLKTISDKTNINMKDVNALTKIPNTGLLVNMTVAGVQYEFYSPITLAVAGSGYPPPPPPSGDPVAQTFIIRKESYPNGVFLSSIDLFFAKAALTEDVQLHIRPVVNGYPSSSVVLPFSVVMKSGADITTSEDGSVATKFTFDAPVYLKPDSEYAIVAIANSTNFEIYSSAIGDFLTADKDVRVSTQPAVGSMFKSQNASTWTAVQEEDIKFNLNACVFNTNAATVDLKTNCAAVEDIDYDLFYMGGEVLDFADTDISYQINTKTQSSNSLTGLVNYQYENNYQLPERMILDNPDALTTQVTLKTNDKYISPVLDLTRLSSVLVKNLVNNTVENELLPTGGYASAKYMHRKVTLADGMDAKDLTVFFNCKTPIGCSVKVYYKAAPSYVTQFELTPWVEMKKEYGNDTPDSYSEFKYVTYTDSALTTTDINGDPERYKYYSVKVVMLSANPVRVPEISDLRVISLDD